jgi:hypothetical protein
MLYKGVVEAISQLNEPHLLLVCVQVRPGEYVVWTVNKQVMMEYSDCGCSNGDYFVMGGTAQENRARALAAFCAGGMALAAEVTLANRANWPGRSCYDKLAFRQVVLDLQATVLYH